MIDLWSVLCEAETQSKKLVGMFIVNIEYKTDLIILDSVNDAVDKSIVLHHLLH